VRKDSCARPYCLLRECCLPVAGSGIVPHVIGNAAFHRDLDAGLEIHGSNKMKTHPSRGNRRGFNLVEWLVVVVIMVGLAAVVFTITSRIGI
jgi:prepilin-type N-terminal cleavage/methylation domain-containing protein